jgi:hypothetical protein
VEEVVKVDKNINILNNSKEFFESLSPEEFDQLLDRFGFEYTKVDRTSNKNNKNI